MDGKIGRREIDDMTDQKRSSPLDPQDGPPPWLPIDFSGLPESLRGGMERWIRHGVRPGHFLSAVIENDLFEVFQRADIENRNRLPEILRWFYDQAPVASYGSERSARAWAKRLGRSWSR